jgi:hypothetical protein
MTCKGCHWFQPDENAHIPFGQCRLKDVFRDGGLFYSETMAFPVTTDGTPQQMPALTLAVYPDFGCVQFKARTTVPDDAR